MREIFGILVTYNSDIQKLERNIESILDQVDKVVIFDNGSGNREDIAKSDIIGRCEVYYSDKNIGLGGAYNYWLNKYCQNYSYFVTFDQDTWIPSNTLVLLQSILDSNRNIGIVGPSFSRSNSSTTEDGKVLDTYTIIQSCCLFRTELLQKVGGFNEDYFIDSVDFEYCLRVGKAGYRVVKYDGVTIEHSLGSAKRKFGINYYSHNCLRNYYIARNHRHISSTYFMDFPYFILKKNFFFVLHILKVLFLEMDMKKIKCLFKGLMNKSYE
ncbi:glycosyltransferase [Sphingobacterium sp. SYP-B4668]|uniref:glycosyltransferase n=1 Tax=Sphingobacterium sp. SYP-B4668 TaxID=2996035 RepID=UPI0022DD17A1|nr:glycosyltransferase [Sphingobacterium sp. SYP-B4668]